MLKVCGIVEEIIEKVIWDGPTGKYWSRELKKDLEIKDVLYPLLDETNLVDVKPSLLKRQKIVTELSDRILKDWFGPDGQCWDPKKRRFVDPDTSSSPECRPLNSQDIRQYRYLRLHDDYRSM